MSACLLAECGPMALIPLLPHGVSHSPTLIKQRQNIDLVWRITALPDENNEACSGFDYVVGQFVFWVAQHCGLPIAVEALRAMPCIFPDWTRYGRPCPPPPHSDWEQERGMWARWFIVLYVWQGGLNCGPNWRLIEQDLKNGGDKYIEHKRLPGRPNAFVRPHHWNEAQTREYSASLRSTFGPTGRLLEEHTDTTFQFCAIFLGAGPEIHYVEDVFRDRIHESFQAVLQNDGVDVRTTRDVSGMFPQEARDLMETVDALVEGNVMRTLWDRLMALEQQPRRSESLLGSLSQAWPQPAMLVRRDTDSWVLNFVQYRYPEAFRDWRHDDNRLWTLPVMLSWIKLKPFIDAQSGLVKLGYDGFVHQQN
ncbi:hypothetical protein FRC09_020971, partial [Ceratobasidium sp. 395]